MRKGYKLLFDFRTTRPIFCGGEDILLSIYPDLIAKKAGIRYNFVFTNESVGNHNCFDYKVLLPYMQHAPLYLESKEIVDYIKELCAYVQKIDEVWRQLYGHISWLRSRVTFGFPDQFIIEHLKGKAASEKPSAWVTSYMRATGLSQEEAVEEMKFNAEHVESIYVRTEEMRLYVMERIKNCSTIEQLQEVQDDFLQQIGDNTRL